MLFERNGATPRAHASATIAASATVVGNFWIAARAYVIMALWSRAAARWSRSPTSCRSAWKTSARSAELWS